MLSLLACATTPTAAVGRDCALDFEAWSPLRSSANTVEQLSHSCIQALAGGVGLSHFDPQEHELLTEARVLVVAGLFALAQDDSMRVIQVLEHPERSVRTTS